MMTMDAFDTIFTTIVAACNQFGEYAWFVPSDSIYEIMIHDQQLLIQAGTMLEQYGFADTPVIGALENICEDMYQQIYGAIDVRIKMLPQMRSDLARALHELRAFVPGDVLSVVVIVKNEARDIREWIEFHRIVGVTHFYIYDNGSEDDLKEVLQPYMDAGIVTYLWWPGEEQQMVAYNDAVVKYREKTRFMAMIDADEYLLPVEDKELLDVLDEVFALDFRAGCVGVNWREYGSSGLERRAEGLVTETHLYRGKDEFNRNAHVKAICNPRKVNQFPNPHFPIMQEKSLMITESGTMFNLSFCYESICKKLRINHYYIKSREEFFEKVMRGWPDQINCERRNEDIAYSFELHERELNQVYDPIMERYLPELRRRMSATE